MRNQLTKEKYLTEKEQEEIESFLENRWDRNSVLIKFALATGARATEILNITLHDLDDKTHSVYIHGLKGSDDRQIPLEKALYTTIKALGEANCHGRPFDIGYSRLVQIWKQYSNKKFHSLRHTAGLETYKRTKDMQLVRAMLGHASVTSTDVYVKAVYKDKLLKELLKKK